MILSYVVQTTELLISQRPDTYFIKYTLQIFLKCRYLYSFEGIQVIYQIRYLTDIENIIGYIKGAEAGGVRRGLR